MKKTLLFLSFISSVFVFSQSPNERIQNYIDENQQKFNLKNTELNQWKIESETTVESAGITNYLVLQTFNGVKVDNSFIYFWIKNNAVINTPEGFITDLSSKVNTANPRLNVVQGFSEALSKLNESAFSTTIISTDKNKFKLSNGILTEDPVNAELVYFPNAEGNLILSWSYEFYSQDAKHLWKVKIDATTGNLLEKYDLVHNCSFGPRESHSNCASTNAVVNFGHKMYKSNAFELMTPGTTNYRVIPWNYESPNHSARQLITNP